MRIYGKKGTSTSKKLIFVNLQTPTMQSKAEKRIKNYPNAIKSINFSPQNFFQQIQSERER